MVRGRESGHEIKELTEYQKLLRDWVDACHEENDCGDCPKSELCSWMFVLIDAWGKVRWNGERKK